MDEIRDSWAMSHFAQGTCFAAFGAFSSGALGDVLRSIDCEKALNADVTYSMIGSCPYESMNEPIENS